MLNLCAPKSLHDFRANLLVEFNKKRGVQLNVSLSGGNERLDVFWKCRDNPSAPLEDMGLLFKRQDPEVDDGLWMDDEKGSIRLPQWIAFCKNFHKGVCHVVLMASRVDQILIVCRILGLNGTDNWS